MSKNKGGALGNRMKRYEEVPKTLLVRRMPAIIRVDGKAFHSFTKGMTKPFDEELKNAMVAATKELCREIQGAKIAYSQSDEISILVIDYEKIGTDAWFDYQVQKMASVSASIWSAYMNEFIRPYTKKIALCDSRVFNLPKEEVNNYFLWRQQDATKNSISMVAQSLFSHGSLQGLSGPKMQEKMFQEKGINWNNLPTWQKRGLCVTKQEIKKKDSIRYKWEVDNEIPIFSQDSNYIEQYIYKEKPLNDLAVQLLDGMLRDDLLSIDEYNQIIDGEPLQFSFVTEEQSNG